MQVHNVPGRHSHLHGLVQTHTQTHVRARACRHIPARIAPPTYGLARIHEAVYVAFVLKSVALQLNCRAAHMSAGGYAHARFDTSLSGL